MSLQILVRRPYKMDTIPPMHLRPLIPLSPHNHAVYTPCIHSSRHTFLSTMYHYTFISTTMGRGRCHLLVAPHRAHFFALLP